MNGKLAIWKSINRIKHVIFYVDNILIGLEIQYFFIDVVKMLDPSLFQDVLWKMIADHKIKKEGHRF